MDSLASFLSKNQFANLHSVSVMYWEGKSLSFTPGFITVSQDYRFFTTLINYLRFRIVHKFFQENVKVGLVLSWGPTRIWPLKSSPPTQVPPHLPTQGWLYPLHSSIHIYSQLRGPNLCLQDWEIKLHHKILLWLLRKQLSVCIQHFYKQRMCLITRRTK